MKYVKKALVFVAICGIGFIGHYKGRDIIKDFRKTTPMPTITLWSKNWPIVSLTNCSHKEFMNKGRNSHPNRTSYRYLRTGLVSSPGNGNTWSRHLIEQATGIWSGTVYPGHDPELWAAGFRGNNDLCKDNTTIVMKAHDSPHDRGSHCVFDRVILVIRDTYRGFLAEYNRVSSPNVSHVGLADKKLFLTKDWLEYVKKMSMWWVEINLKWIRRYKDKDKNLKNDQNPFEQPANFWSKLLMVSYEKLKKDPVKEAERIVEFLGLPVFRKHCVEENANGQFKRKIQQTVEEVACLYSLHSEVQELMKKSDSHLAEESRILGVGNILSEAEGISEVYTTKGCAY